MIAFTFVKMAQKRRFSVENVFLPCLRRRLAALGTQGSRQAGGNMTGAQACSASTKRFLRFSAFYDAFVLSLSWQMLALLFSNREIPDRKSRERKKKKRKEKHFDSHAHFILKMHHFTKTGSGQT
jgi:hypothetical protein